jgi:hypothetical protein
MYTPAMPPGPELRYLYEHQTAKSAPQSCRRIGTLPIACARSQPTMQPCHSRPSVRSGLCAVRAPEEGERWTDLVSALAGDGLHREPLAGVVLHAAEEHERDPAALALDDVEDVGFAEREFAGVRGQLEHGVGGVKAVEGRLGGECVLGEGQGQRQDVP